MAAQVADLAALETALVNADKAGDASAARILASEIQLQRAKAMQPDAVAEPAPQGVLQNMGAGFMGAMRGAGTAIGALDALGYKAGGAVTDAMAGTKDATGRTASPEGAAATGAAVNAIVSGLPAIAGNVYNLGGGLIRSGAERVMQSALKPGVRDLLSGKADRAVGTLLDEGINVTRGGAEKLRGLGNQANAEAQAALANSTATVDKNAVASRLGDVERRFQSQVNPQADLNAIQDADTAFLTHPDLAGKQTMPVQLAQALKQGTYKQLADKYGELGSAQTEAQKALARGLKEEIEAAVLGVVEPNARASQLFNALNVTQRRAMVNGNNNLTGLAGAAMNPKMAGVMALDRSSLVKSLLARILNNSQRVPATVAGGAAGAYMGTPDNGE